MIFLRTSNAIRTLRTLSNPIYYKVLMYVLDLIGVLSIIYINLNSSNFKLCLGDNIKNIIDIEYLWTLVAIIVLKNIVILYLKGTGNIIDILLLAVTNIVLHICSGVLVLFSYSLSQLKNNYIDSLSLKYDLNIIRIWQKGELKEYLLNKLLKEPGILVQFECLEGELPLTEKITSSILANSKTIGDVNNAVINIINVIKQRKTEKKLLEEEQAAVILNEMKQNISLLSTKVCDYNPYWLLGCTTVGVLLVAIIALVLYDAVYQEVPDLSYKVIECTKKLNTLLEHNTDEILSENLLKVSNQLLVLDQKLSNGLIVLDRKTRNNLLDLEDQVRVLDKKINNELLVYDKKLLGLDNKLIVFDNKVVVFDKKVVVLENKVVVLDKEVMYYEDVVLGLSSKVLYLGRDSERLDTAELGLDEKVLGLENKVLGLDKRVLDFNDKVLGLDNKLLGLDKKVIDFDNKVVCVYDDISEKFNCLADTLDVIEEDAQSANNLLAISASKMGTDMHGRLSTLENTALVSNEVTSEQEKQLKILLSYIKETLAVKLQEIDEFKETIPSIDNESLKEIVKEIVKEIMAQNS